MLIRSQDKSALLNVDQIQIIYASGKKILCNLRDCSAPIGEYSTESKAIKVLDKIQEAYELSLYCDHAFDNAAQVQRPYIFVSNTVFRMPSDEEVEG
jgi:hypothetical protein